MNFNFNSQYIEFDSEDIPYSIYEIEGVSKITELSRQLRTFLNYKAATIHYRFQPKTVSCCYQTKKSISEIEVKLKKITSKFINLLIQIKGNSVSYEIELKKKILGLLVNEDNKNQIKDLRNLTKKLFMIIHLLSEQEIYIYPLLLKFILNLSQEACIVYKILNKWASGYYDELRLNYAQLFNELKELIQTNQTYKNYKKEHRDLEVRLKE